MKAFLSSTYIDLVEYRREVLIALESIGQQVGRMEIFGARSEEAVAACLSEIEDCDVFIGIYAHRYGHIPDSSSQSITEQEFHHARQVGIPSFCFVIDERYPWPPSMIDREVKYKKLRKFIEHVRASVIAGGFDSPSSLALHVQSAVLHFLLKGSQSAYFNQEGLRELSRWGELMVTSGEWNWNNLGTAGEHFLQSVKLDARNQDPWTNLAYVYHLIGNKQRADYCIKNSYRISTSKTPYKGNNYRRVCFAIRENCYKSGGVVVRPAVPDWFQDTHRLLYRHSVLFQTGSDAVALPADA